MITVSHARLSLLLSVRSAGAAPALTGLWLTQDRNGVIAISHCGDRLCAPHRRGRSWTTRTTRCRSITGASRNATCH